MKWMENKPKQKRKEGKLIPFWAGILNWIQYLLCDDISIFKHISEALECFYICKLLWNNYLQSFLLGFHPSFTLAPDLQSLT